MSKTINSGWRSAKGMTLAQLLALVVLVLLAIVAFLRTQGVPVPDLDALTSTTAGATTTSQPPATTTAPGGTTTSQPPTTTTAPPATTTTRPPTTTTPPATTTTAPRTTTTAPPQSGSILEIRDGLRNELARPLWDALMTTIDAYIANLWEVNSRLVNARNKIEPLDTYLNNGPRKSQLYTALGGANSQGGLAFSQVLTRISLLKTELWGPATAAGQRNIQDIEELRDRAKPCSFDDYWKNDGQGGRCLTDHIGPLGLTKQRHDAISGIHASIQANQPLRDFLQRLAICRSMPTSAPTAGGQPHNVLCGEVHSRITNDIHNETTGILAHLSDATVWLATNKYPWMLIPNRTALVAMCWQQSGQDKTMHWLTRFTTFCQHHGINYTVGGFGKSAHDAITTARIRFGSIQSSGPDWKVASLADGLHEILRAMYWIGRINGDHGPTPAPTTTPGGGHGCPPVCFK